MQPTKVPLVSTISERCRVCYTCVRECPAKAIRIAGRRAEVMAERCIGCGNCVRVCSQHAKKVASALEEVRELLHSGVRVAALIAPSFPAEFVDLDYEIFLGMIRALGFQLLNEVAFGADLVATEYRRLLARDKERRYIATSCPAVVAYVERYHPDMVTSLAPIVSPMVATARVVRKLYGDEVKTVFVGPCVAKKGEAISALVGGDVDAVMTFTELRELFHLEGVDSTQVKISEFDPPHSGAGALFPITRGMLQAARIDEDLLRGEVVAADGRTGFSEAIREFESGDLGVQLLEALCCNGCIMGPGLTTTAPLFRRRERVSRYVRQRIKRLNWATWDRNVAELSTSIDLARHFLANDQRLGAESEDEIRSVLARMGKLQPEDELNCGACGYETCREHAVAIHKGLAESEMCLPYTIDQLRKTCEDLTVSNEQLDKTREALVQSEKLASMGQLAAGIAHEVNNPLGTVLMLSHILLEEAEAKGPQREDLAMIVSEADRCKKIVSGLLQFARKNKVEAREVDLHGLVTRAMRTMQIPPNVEVWIEPPKGDMTAEIDHDQMVQVLANLTSNAIAAMPNGGVLTIRTGGDEASVWFSVSDTGVGIPKEHIKKVFEPFFTTKAVGQGTGLGLAVIYGVVKMHNGDIKLESNADPAKGPTGTTLTVMLPRWRRPPGANGTTGEADGST